MIDAVHSYGHKTCVIPVSVPFEQSIADKLWGPWWVDVKSLEKIGKGLTKIGGRSYFVYRIEDQEILDAMEKLKGEISAEPSGAAGFAILYRMKKIVNTFDPKKNSVVVLNTGNGLRNFHFNDGS
jgi:threonine synthase